MPFASIAERASDRTTCSAHLSAELRKAHRGTSDTSPQARAGDDVMELHPLSRFRVAFLRSAKNFLRLTGGIGMSRLETFGDVAVSSRIGFVRLPACFSSRL